MDTTTNDLGEQGMSGEMNEQKSFFNAPENKKGKLLLAVSGVVVLVIVLVLAVFFGDFIGARAVGFGGPRISVRQGETVSLKFVTKQGVMGRKVEICSKALLKTTCKNLAFKVSQDLSTIDTVIPANYKLGRADLRLTGIYENGVSVLLGLKGVLVKPYVAENNGGGSSGGSGNGGGSDSGSSDSGSTSPSTPVPTATPTAPLPYGPY